MADFATWTGNEDSSNNTLTRALMTTFALSQSGSGDDGPTVWVTNPATFGKIHAIVDPQERYEANDNLKIGFKNLTMNGTPIVVDKHSPGSGSGSTDNWLFALNENRMGFTIHSDYNFKMGQVLEPITQDAKMQKVLFGAALWIDRRDRQGAFQAINPAL